VNFVVIVKIREMLVARFDAVLLNVQVFWDVMLCGLYFLHLNVHAVQEECC
jgi:hypothetical protein